MEQNATAIKSIVLNNQPFQDKVQSCINNLKVSHCSNKCEVKDSKEMFHEEENTDYNVETSESNVTPQLQ